MAEKTFDDIRTQFEQFLSLVSKVLVHEKEINLLQNKLRRHFNSTLSSYLCSADFQVTLNDLYDKFNRNDNSTKYFKLLSSFDEQLKKHSIKLIRSSQQVPPSSSLRTTNSRKTITSACEKTVIISSNTIALSLSSSTTNEYSIITSKQTTEQTFDSCNNIFTVLDESQLPNKNTESKITTNTVNSNNEYEIKQEKKIRKLERRLNSLSKMIRQLEEKDMSLDEMENCDLYKVESSLKKRACDMYMRLAQLKKQSTSTERILDQPVTLTETDIDYPLINKALEDMINRTKYLPSFQDVLDIVKKTNNQYKLNFSIDAEKDLATKSFKLIGKKVKDRRMADFNDIMYSRLPENFDIERNDPALNSSAIEKVLIENERKAVVKTQKIFNEFSQMNPELEPEENIETEESTVESDNDDDEDNEQEALIESSNNKMHPTHYDMADILPPLSSRSSSPTPTPVNKTTAGEDFLEAKVNISLNSTEEPQSIILKPEDQVQTIIPRRRQQQLTSNNETLYNQITDTTKKRSISKDIMSSELKKRKDQPEVVVLD
ncbi:unnamed protein product [Adineta steineri]|uniref:Daxx histone-binding domain-containing protein n=1 Tax=Adineta steineri TaxID=433720 RepID=A0A819ESW2_9BILA|nr:unnamed protein product [Adineta steineri]CAF3853905.1 unnamed protein product [Adineta steineri]